MIFIGIIGAVALFALILGPQWWVRSTMVKHGEHRPDYPGTGGELARHLLDEHGLQSVKIETTEQGDHYSPKDKTVRLSKGNHDGRSVTAVAVAAHEVSHAIQDAQNYAPLHLRQTLVQHAVMIERIGGLLLLATPVIFALIRSPAVLVFQAALAIGILAVTVMIHAVTLPTEFDASFNRALPLLKHYLPDRDMQPARKVLSAAAFTYVASALISLVDIARWFRILRF